MAEGNKALVRRWLDEVLTQGNLRRVDELFAPNYALHDLSFPQEVHGREGIRRYVAASRAAYPDACFVIEDQVGSRKGYGGDPLDGSQSTHRGSLRGYRPPAPG